MSDPSKHTHAGDGTVPGLHGEPIPTPVLGCPACSTVRSIGGELGKAPEDLPTCRHCGYSQTWDGGRDRGDARHDRPVSAAAAWEEAQLARSTSDLPEDFWELLATVDDAAALAGVTPSTVHNWITRGYVDRWGDRRWLTGFHIDGVRRVLPLDVLRVDAELRHAGRGGLRKRPM